MRIHCACMASLVLFGSTAACSKKVESADISSFIAAPGTVIPPICTKENAGKRFVLTGYLKLPENGSIDDNDHIDLPLYAEVEPDGAGKGRSASITVKNGTDIDDLFNSAKGVKRAGYQMKKGEVSEDALKIHAKNGDATTKNKLRVTVELETVTHFQTKAITACNARWIEGEKI